MPASEHGQYAIYVKNARKFYGEKKVLNNLCMKVPRGCIYGLLGASGCGKTTLLNCLMYLRKVDSGDIYVLGGKPGASESAVPGPAVGYMPQDIALVDEFTVKDAVYYFGRIHDLQEWDIKERLEMLKVLLELPPDNSGGQQRRVSLAAAMVHKPQLLILDEPTVGLDPVLRNNIWNHLVDLAEKEQTTIIITTHYIEEARQADKIGLMREGELLTEDSPERLLQLFSTETLEEVYFILSKRQQEGRLNHTPQMHSSSSVLNLPLVTNGSTELLSSVPPQKKQQNNNISAFRTNKHHLKSLMSKNYKQCLRSFSGLVFAVSYPIIEILIFLATVGRDPHDLKLAIVNDDAHFKQCANYSRNGTAVPDIFGNCHFNNLACRFLNEIENPMFAMEYYLNRKDAFEDMRHGKVVGVLHMAQNFSRAYSNRVNNGRKVSDEDLKFSEVKIWLDMSNRQIGEIAKARLYGLYQDFQVSIFKDCNYFDKFGRFPMRFNFEYNSKENDYNEFMLPALLLSMLFFLGASSTTTIVVRERLEGLWDRSIVAGVNSMEIVLTHFATQFMLVLMQTCESVVLTFVICDRDYEGDLFLIFLFILLQGLLGVVVGFCISIVSPNHGAAHMTCGGLLISMIMLCGFMWPLEGQLDSLRFFTMYLPFSVPIVSLRKVIKKGYGWNEWQVWDGLTITMLWILIFALISILALKAKR